MFKKLLAFFLAMLLVTGARPAVYAASPVWENNRFVLHWEADSAFFTLTDKANGYAWSNRPLSPRYERMSLDWQRFAESLAVVDFLTESGAVRRAQQSETKPPEYALLSDGFAVTLSFPDADITLTLEIRLTDTGITAYVPDESIVCAGSAQLSQLILLPFLGASYADEIPGYIFIPDGCGALMRFAAPKDYGSSFVGRIYGTDYGVSGGVTQRAKSFLEVSLQQVYYPVFGIAHGENQNAFLAVIESGDAFCEIEANPAGNIVDYHWVAPRFIYRELYWQPMGQGTGFNTATPFVNSVNAQVAYHFLSEGDANYAGMANQYRQTLLADGLLTPRSVSGDIPLKLDAIMSEQRKSLFGSSAHVMTRTQDVSRWLYALTDAGIRNLTASLIGVQKGGISGHTVGTFAIEGKTGGNNGLERLYHDAQKLNVGLTLQTDYASGYEHQLSASRAVYGVNGAFITEIIQKPLFSIKRFLNAESLANIAAQFAKQKDYKRGLSLDKIANTLLSDYNKRHTLYRDEALTQHLQTLASFKQNAQTLLLESPNVYAVPYADAIYHTPDTHSQQIYETEVVPFYQIVLSGYVDMFTPYLNYRSNSVADLLKLIDYHMYPAYLLTEQYSNEFNKTNIMDVYSSRYADWEPLIQSHYHMVNEVLRSVRGQSVISREEVAPGVFVSRYSGGGAVVVNYSETPYSYGSTTVAALSGVYTDETGR